MSKTQILNLYRLAQTTYHSLCTHTQPPPGVEHLLWNGLKYCIESPLPKPNLSYTMEKLTQQIRLKYFWSKQQPNDTEDEYNPKLHIPSSWEPPPANVELEEALSTFQAKASVAIKTNLKSQKRSHNIPTSSRQLLRILPDSTTHIVLPTDKNLGPAILERNVYKQRCIQDHLSDKSTYRQLTATAAYKRLHSSEQAFKALVATHKKQLDDVSTTYFKRAFQEPRRVPQFYCTPKVHKTPWKTRPIVSCVSSPTSSTSSRRPPPSVLEPSARSLPAGGASQGPPV